VGTVATENSGLWPSLIFSCSASESLELSLYANSSCGTFMSVFQRLYDDIDVSRRAVMMKYARRVLSSSPGHVTDETLLSHLHVRTGCSTFPRSRGNKQHVTTATSTDFLILCIPQLWLLTDTSDGLILNEIISSSLGGGRKMIQIAMPNCQFFQISNLLKVNVKSYPKSFTCTV